MTKQLTTTEALKILYNHEDLQGGHDEYWKAYRFIEKRLQALDQALEIIKKYILKDLVFDDEEQSINYSFAIYTFVNVIKDKTKYDLLKKVLK